MALSILSKASTCCILFTLTSAQIFAGSSSSNSNSYQAIAPPLGLSDACTSTFSFKLACDSVLPSIALSGAFVSPEELLGLCTSDCLQSLYDLRASQEQSCSNDTMVSSQKLWPITTTTDIMLWAYKFTCHKDSTGQLCAHVFDAWANGNASNATCSDCVLGTYQLSLNNSLRYHDDAASSLASLTASCSATGYTVTSPPALTVSASSTSTTSYTKASAACESKYTIVANEDCHSISLSQNVSTASLLYLNHLQTGCTNFPPPGTDLCLPHSCKTYTVKKNDNCGMIIMNAGNAFTRSQLVSWNLDINDGCDNLEMLVDQQICLSFPGEVYQPAPANTSIATTAVLAPTNVANGTNTQCSTFYTVQSGDTCSSIVVTSNIALLDFYFLNPELNNTGCSNLMLGAAYCVGAVGTISTYPGYNGRPTNPCVAGTAAADPSCYATSYETNEVWSFPVATTFARNITSSALATTAAATPNANSTIAGSPLCTNSSCALYPCHSNRTTVAFSTNARLTTAYSMPSAVFVNAASRNCSMTSLGTTADPSTFDTIVDMSVSTTTSGASTTDLGGSKAFRSSSGPALLS